MKRYYLYQITNLITGHFYIGKRACPLASYRDIARDYYFGSGSVLRRAIDKYGREHFRKDILAEVGSLKMLDRLEEAVVDASFVARADTYNAKVGGVGGGKGRPKGVRFSEEHKRHLSIAAHNRKTSPRGRELRRIASMARTRANDGRFSRVAA